MNGRGEGRRFKKGQSGNPDGRPSQNFFFRRDRYSFVIQNTLIALGRSQRAAAKIMAGITMGRLFIPGTSSPDFEVYRAYCDRAPAGKVVIGYQLDVSTTTPAGRRSALRKELRNLKQDPNVALWLHRMTEIMMIAWRPTDESDKVRMFETALTAGEYPFAKAVLEPVFDWNLARN